VERDLDEELRATEELLVHEKSSTGLTPRAARRAAAVEIGGLLQVKERVRDARTGAGLDVALQDVRYAVRGLRRTPGFSLVAILTLALGIGATAAIVSTVRAVLLRPLPYDNPESLVMVWEEMKWSGVPQMTPAPANYFDWLERNQVFDDMAATAGAPVTNLTGDGVPEQIMGRRVTANFFGVLGARPLLGRTFSDAEERQIAPVVVISHSLWRRRYLGDPGIVGRTLTMNGASITVVGVMSQEFVFRNRDIEFWVPAAFTPVQRANRSAHLLNVVARLAPGVGVQQAQEHMTTLAKELAREYPENERVGVEIIPIRDDVFGRTRRQLIVLTIAALCMLLIVCANLAGVQLARAAARQQEMATRAALGGSRSRLLGQLLIEGVVCSLAGGIAGIGVTLLGIGVLTAIVPTTLPENTTPQLDARLLAFMLVVSVVTGLTFSVLPAVSASRTSLGEVMKQRGRAIQGGRNRARAALTVLQVATTFVLLVGTGLMIRTLANLRAVDIGINTSGLLTLRTALPISKYGDARSRQSFYERALEGVRTVPGVTDAGFSSTLPFLSLGNMAGYRISGRSTERGDPATALFRVTTNDYLKTLGVKLLDGRLPGSGDKPDSPPVVVITETFARRYWPGTSAVGARIALNDPDAAWMMVVGVIRDVYEIGYDREMQPGMYVLASQLQRSADNLVVRVAGDPLAIAPAVRQVIAGIDRDQPIAAVQTMDHIIDRQIVDRRLQSIVFGAFAGIALLVSSIGLFGLLSYAVTQQSREIGLRMALGATMARVKTAIIGRGVVLTVTGLGLGLVAALATIPAMGSLLYGVQPNDPLTIGVVFGAFFAIALVACWIPARRATRVDPMVALRCE
jgi:predicted permease